MAVSLMRTLVMYGVILVAVRLMGKRQISQLQTSELVATLLVSELAVLPIQEMDQPLWKGIIPMGVLVGCEILVSFLMLKSGRFRQAVCGSPVVVIRQGKVLQDQMRRLRLTTEDLYEQLRQNNVFYLEDVAWAIVETNGRLSVIRHPEEEPLTPRQLGLQPEFPGLEVVVVSDGVLSRRSLALCGKDGDWVRQKLQEHRLDLSQVFLMAARTDGTCTLIKKQKKGAPDHSGAP